jgi:hypothetical protein
MSGGYSPTQTDPASKLIQTQLATYRKLRVDPQLWPRSAGSWPKVQGLDVAVASFVEYLYAVA